MLLHDIYGARHRAQALLSRIGRVEFSGQKVSRAGEQGPGVRFWIKLAGLEKALFCRQPMLLGRTCRAFGIAGPYQCLLEAEPFQQVLTCLRFPDVQVS